MVLTAILFHDFNNCEWWLPHLSTFSIWYHFWISSSTCSYLYTNIIAITDGFALLRRTLVTLILHFSRCHFFTCHFYMLFLCTFPFLVSRPLELSTSYHFGFLEYPRKIAGTPVNAVRNCVLHLYFTRPSYAWYKTTINVLCINTRWTTNLQGWVIRCVLNLVCTIQNWSPIKWCPQCRCKVHAVG